MKGQIKITDWLTTKQEEQEKENRCFTGEIYDDYKYMTPKKPTKGSKPYTAFLDQIEGRAHVFPGRITVDDLYTDIEEKIIEVRLIIGDEIYDRCIRPDKPCTIWRYGWTDTDNEEEALKYVENKLNTEIKEREIIKR